MSKKIKKQCAIPNCSNPKCPFPHPKEGDKLKSPLKPKHYLKPLPDFDYKIPPVTHTDEPVVIARISQEAQAQDICASGIREYTEDLLRCCKRCGVSFTLTVGELNWFVKKQFSLPKRCKECRIAQRHEGKDEAISEKVDDTIWV